MAEETYTTTIVLSVEGSNEEKDGLIIHVASQKDGELLEGPCLSDNNVKNIPTENGIYVCEVVIINQEYTDPFEPTEYGWEIRIVSSKKVYSFEE